MHLFCENNYCAFNNFKDSQPSARRGWEGGRGAAMQRRKLEDSKNSDIKQMHNIITNWTANNTPRRNKRQIAVCNKSAICTECEERRWKINIFFKQSVSIKFLSQFDGSNRLWSSQHNHWCCKGRPHCDFLGDHLTGYEELSWGGIRINLHKYRDVRESLGSRSTSCATYYYCLSGEYTAQNGFKGCEGICTVV